MIFLHRQNDPEFIQFKNVDGIELDIRSIGSDLVLTHDRLSSHHLENSSSLIYLAEVVQHLKNYTVIVNVKESGLEEQISDLFDDNNIKYYFLDSQIPDILRLSKKEEYKGKFIIRVSQFENINYDLLNFSKPEFVWVDYSFENFN